MSFQAHIIMAVHSDYVHDSRVRREAETLIETGRRVTVLAASHQPERTTPFAFNQVQVIPLPLSRSGGKLKFLEMMRSVSAAIKDPDADAVHAHDPDALVPLARFASRKKIPLIYDSHELYTETHAVHNRLMVKKMWKTLEGRYIRRCSAVITVSEGIAGALQQMYQLDDKPVVLRNFSDPVPGASEENLPLINIPKTPLKGIYQGALQHGRGLNELIEAVAENPEWCLIICGDGPLRGELSGRTRELGAEGRVIFTGMLDPDRLQACMKISNAGFILTEPQSKSQRFSLPNKLSEYVHHGLPVIFSDLPEVDQLNRKHEFGWKVQGKKDMSKLLKHFPGKSSIGDSIRKASEEMRWSKEKQKLIELYAGLLP